MNGLEAPTSDSDIWVLAGDVAMQLVADIANRAKDRADDALDAKRISDGKTLDEHLRQQ
jgi:hypothetical protein